MQVVDDAVRLLEIGRPRAAVAVHPDRVQSRSPGAFDIHLRMIADVQRLIAGRTARFHGGIEDDWLRLGRAGGSGGDEAIEEVVDSDFLKAGVTVGDCDEPEARPQRFERRTDIREQLEIVSGLVEDRERGIDIDARVAGYRAHAPNDLAPDEGQVVGAIGMLLEDLHTQFVGRFPCEFLEDPRIVFAILVCQALLGTCDHRPDRPQRVVEIDRDGP